MKILDKYILKSFLVPFFATFLIVLFVLVMQALWLVFDDIAGKGIDIVFIVKFLFYTSLIVAPQALPIGVLLSSIMALGNLSEHYEFAAAKSAGVSLQRLVRPLVFLAIFLSVVNFFFLNNVYPYAMLKQINMKLNIKKKKPTLALIPGGFNTEIPNYHIKFDEKYGEDNNLLKNVMIYDLSESKGNKKIITAERGKIISEEGSRYMTFLLYDGHFFENHIKTNAPYNSKLKMPASYADFKEYQFNIDISSLTNGDDIEAIKYSKNYNMLNLNQINDTLPDIKNAYDEYITLKAKDIDRAVEIDKLYNYPDSLKNKKLNPDILANFSPSNKVNILEDAIQKVKIRTNNFKNSKEVLKRKRKVLNLFDVEYYNRIAFSLSCLILFFIGAPLGSIIRKGGMGLPMILAIAIYVIYFFTNTFGRNLAEESSVTAILGSWISVILMVPFGILLTRRATRDKGLFNIDSFLQPITRLFKKLTSNKKNI